MTTTGDLDVSTRPSKWKKRGPQPALEDKPKAPLIALTKLAKRIREATDPEEKRQLEAEYAAASKGMDDLTSDATSHKLSEAITEIVDTFTVIIDPHPDSEEAIRTPETMTREQWQEVHAKLIQCKRAAAGWLAKSRKFATDRWGVEYVEKCEAQMELALGIEHTPAPSATTPAPADYLKAAQSIAKRTAKLSDLDLASLDNDQRKAMLDALLPIADIIAKLQAGQG